ncbi:hypothetical protein AYJ59_07110 [Thiomicrospira sp. S5]|nr:hypothetical protein AYJ59_07110 [Thiomicrospira sp. S5]
MFILAGCSGHDFEGKFQTKADSPNAFLNQFTNSLGSQTIVIGPDYIESDGQRELFDKIFVRNSDGQKYLIFKKDNTEDAWKIVDENTLVQGNGLVQIKLVRVE